MRKTFSIVDVDVIKFLESMERGEMSRYVTRLIREDMKRDKCGLSRDEVIKLIREYGGVERESKEDNKVVSAAKNLINL
jgi:hypothetical protein